MPGYTSAHHLASPPSAINLRYAGRSRKILIGNQQVTLLGDAWRVAKPRANHLEREFALQFRLPAGTHRVEQRWPTRDAGATQ